MPMSWTTGTPLIWAGTKTRTYAPRTATAVTIVQEIFVAGQRIADKCPRRRETCWHSGKWRGGRLGQLGRFLTSLELWFNCIRYSFCSHLRRGKVGRAGQLVPVYIPCRQRREYR